MTEDIFKENVKLSFSRSRAHIDSLETQIKVQNAEIQALKAKIDKLLSTLEKPSEVEKPISEPQKHQIPKNSNNKKIFSTGNKGVFRQTLDRQSTTFRQPDNQIHSLEDLKTDFINRFRSLTDKEFMVFMAIYHLEEELQRPITYSDIAAKLKLSQSSIRDHISEILLKNLPISKEISTNRRVYLTIKPELRDLELMDKLLRIRYPTPTKQSTLFDL